MQILFICSANKQRSKTAEDYYRKYNPKHQFMSAGTNHKVCIKEGTTLLTEDLLIKADCVFVMESKHAKIIEEHTGKVYQHKITILHIADIYEYGDENLVKLLEERIVF